jgi:hypothetical protein
MDKVRLKGENDPHKCDLRHYLSHRVVYYILNDSNSNMVKWQPDNLMCPKIGHYI